MKKTLGGERLGAGKKMQVDLHGYGRSTFDLSYIWRSTMSAGTLVPFLVEVALPGDTFDIELDVDVKTHPTVGPLFGSFKVQGDIFQAPVRLYQGQLHNNKLGIGRNMASVKLPLIELTAINPNPAYFENDLDNAQINPSCLLSYLGIRGVGSIPASEVATATRQFNAVPLLAYWDIYKNYYANKQEEIGYVVHTGAAAVVETIDSIWLNDVGNEIPEQPATNPLQPNEFDTIIINYTGQTPLPSQIIFNTNAGPYSFNQLVLEIYEPTSGQLAGVWDFESHGGNIVINNWRYIYATDQPQEPIALRDFELTQIDEMRERLLGDTMQTSARIINDYNLEPYNLMIELENGKSPMVNSQEGLGIKTYQSDLFNNWLSTEWIDGVDGITSITAIDTSGGSFTLDTLNLSKKVYDLLNRIAVSGGSYDDYLDAAYATERIQRAESPIYHGGLIKELVFQEVVSNAEATGGEGSQPLGTLAGKGTMSRKHKGGQVVVKVDEPAYIMGIISLTPRIDYSQGNRWDIHLRTMDDFHKPALDEIGFQELITENMAWWDTNYDSLTSGWIQKSAGKQPAWIMYMTNVNRTYGNFAVKNNEMFMTLNRQYEPNKAATDAPTTIADLTTYIDPRKYNQIFAQTSLDSQNFWVQIGVNITARRKMSARIMPNL